MAKKLIKTETGAEKWIYVKPEIRIYHRGHWIKKPVSKQKKYGKWTNKEL